MKAALLFGRESLQVQERPVPEAGPGEILLRVRAAAICGTDVRMYRNGFPGVGPGHPLVPGHELAGDIAAVGGGVTAYRPGQRVTVAPNMGCGICPDCIRGNSHMCRDYQALGINLDGGFAEYVLIPETAVRTGNVMLLEDQVSYADAAIVEPLSCVCNGIEQCRIAPGEVVLVIGAGPVGILHAMMARLSGAGQVLVSNRSPERLEHVRQIDPFFRTVAGSPAEAVREATDGRGADVIITACPSPEAQQEAIGLAANYGRICLFGGLPHDRRLVPLDANLIHYRQLVVTGTTRAGLRHFRSALQLVSSGTLPVGRLITGRYRLDDFQEALAASIAGRGLKNVILPGGED